MFSSKELLMKVLERYRLHRDKQAFLDDLRPKYILASLTIRKVITHQESKEIKSQVGISKQVEKLFEILPKKSSECFNSFIEVLEEEDETGASYYPWLAEHLRHKNDNLKKNVYDQLINGGIPFPVNYVLHREKKLEDVRQFLIEASKLKRHWIVLYGMPGTGKSVLAAEAIRDNDIVENYFPGGVYWLQIGNLRNDDNALWLKMKKLFTLLHIESDLCPSESLSELTELLKREINVRNQTLLLILDDVWSNTVIKAFDIGCPILVTTKDKTIMQKLSQFCSPMELRNDLLLQEGRDLLSMYVKCEPSQLPKTVNNIFSKTKGSPSILSLIGSMMEDYGNDFNRWENLNKRLESGIRQAFRLRHGSGDVLNDIKDFLCLMLDSIQYLKEYFKDLIIFCEDVYIPNKLLEIYWGKDPFEVEDIMFELYKKSLVQMQTNAPEAFSYCVTDIYIEILLEDSSTETIKRCHKKLVNNYLELCRQADGEYNFTKLPHDDYIHYYLGYHMFNAEEYELLEKVYLDLGFVEQKLKLTDPRDLLADYKHYRKCFRNEDELIRFESFVERNFNKICNNENTQELLVNDIVQLALFEPSDSIVYKKAKKLVGQLKDKVCFEWCNKGMDGSHFQNLRTRSIAEVLKHAIFSFDNTLIASVGESSKIQIWSTSSHEEIQSFTGHSGSVNSCAFNSDGSKLASASDDGTVKIFKVAAEFSPDIALARKRNSLPAIYSETVKVDIDMSIFTFDEHSAEVLCCAYSPDDSLIISSDSKGCVIVWETECGFIKYRKHHSAPGHSVNFCSFNKSGTVFGAAGYDAIDLWDCENGNLLQTFLHHELRVERFCFTNDGHHIISVFNNSIYKWDLRTNQYTEIKLPSSKNFVILSCCLSADGNFLACGTSDSSVIILDMNSEAVINNLKGHKEHVINVMFSTDGKKLLSVSYGWYIIHDMTAVKNTYAVSFQGNLSVQLKDELLIATSSYWKWIEIRRGFQGELICQTEAEEKEICCLSSSISEVIYGMEDGSLKVLNISSKKVTVLEKHEGRINYILHSKKSRTFFTCSEDKTLRIWKEGESLPVKVLRGHSQSVLMCVQFRICDWLVSCSKDGTLRVWDVVEGDFKFSISEGHGNQDVLFCDISHDDKYIASASADKTVKVWHASNGQLYKSIECSEAVRCCRFYFSSYVLISGDDSGAVTQWHFGGKDEPKLIGYHDSQVRGIYLAVDGSQFITISDDIKLWNRNGTFAQTLLLPTSSSGVTPPSIWTSDNFDIFVIVHNSVLYILKKM